MENKRTPINSMVDAVVRCVKCGAKMGLCDCWTKCKEPGCTWFVEKGKKCGNKKNHAKK
jgi:hypothetical protein